MGWFGHGESHADPGGGPHVGALEPVFSPDTTEDGLVVHLSATWLSLRPGARSGVAVSVDGAPLSGGTLLALALEGQVNRDVALVVATIDTARGAR